MIKMYCVDIKVRVWAAEGIRKIHIINVYFAHARLIKIFNIWTICKYKFNTATNYHRRFERPITINYVKLR